MPLSWTPDLERKLLLLVVTESNFKPSASTWEAIAEKFDATPNTVRYGGGSTPVIHLTDVILLLSLDIF